MAYSIGIDIGGTFTDCAVLDGAGRIATIAKAPTRRGAPDRGVIDAVAAAAARLRITPEALLAETRFFIHGCTVATNAIVERKGVRTGLVTTRGHEHAIFIGKASQKVAGLAERDMTHQSHLAKPDPPIIDRKHVQGVAERVDRDGEVVVRLSEADVDAAIDALRRAGVEAVAISFLWSFANPEHERRTRERIARALPGVFVTASHEIAPLLGEYERTATTVANAYVGPRVIGYVERLASRLAQLGLRYPLLLAHCAGGLTTMTEVAARPLLTLDSGPVSGAIGARFFGAAYGEPNIICADMGGTTFDVSLIEGGRTILDEEPVVDRYTCLIPKVAVESVGAGGGSIVWVDEDGLLRVGPQSAGAEPGPACYGTGTEPTITDVNLVLGMLDALLGGAMKLDRAAAERAIDRVASRAGLDRTAAAAGAFRIVNAHMADLIRRASIDRGRDPRDFVLFAYGGAGPLHIAYLARELGIGKVYVPAFATVFSALGMLTGGVSHSAERSFARSLPLAASDAAELERVLAGLRSELDRLFDEERVAPADRRYEREVHMKYRLQPRALAVAVPEPFDEARLVEAFEARYASLYGGNAGYRAAGLEIIKCKVSGAARTVVPALAKAAVGPSDPAAALRTERAVYFPEIGRYAPTRIFEGDRVRPGMAIDGPAVIERMGDTIVLPSFARATVDGFGNILMTLERR